jgi:hypothetical protein
MDEFQKSSSVHINPAPANPASQLRPNRIISHLPRFTPVTSTCNVSETYLRAVGKLQGVRPGKAEHIRNKCERQGLTKFRHLYLITLSVN